MTRFVYTSLGRRVSDGERVVIKKPMSQLAVMALRDSVKARAISCDKAADPDVELDVDRLEAEAALAGKEKTGSLDAILPKYLTVQLPSAPLYPVVLNYLHGRTLAEMGPMIDRLGDKEMIEFILTMTRVLILSIGLLMDHGLLHRDIKPENAVQKLSAEARDEILKLLRFAREALEDDPDRRPKTAGEYLQILEDGGNLAEV